MCLVTFSDLTHVVIQKTVEPNVVPRTSKPIESESETEAEWLTPAALERRLAKLRAATQLPVLRGTRRAFRYVENAVTIVFFRYVKNCKSL